MIALLSAVSLVSAQTYRMTSLSWPPYSDPDIAQQGASVAVAKAAFRAMGHDLHVDFFPWSRAVRLAQVDSNYIGYFPEYFYQTSRFLFSDPIGTGPLGLVQNIETPIQWTDVTDLKKYRLGVVQDYVNTAEIDRLIANREILVEKVITDAQNVLKVATNRIDTAIIDANVFHYLTTENAFVSRIAERVEMNPKYLVDKQLFVAFRNNTIGKQAREIFNEGLTKINIEEIMTRYMTDVRNGQ